ncbi:hypothetical protein GH714_000278 [Hevea brasiliensis]|uniref:Uncharacterized protein n=1 Tax=Hevea brasiliensis TaxID=3981 RepID=A0A6A6M5X9_HEVBR|nr:hypothetical protein GH714_000278 [Hevea brasiliensis]
MLFLIVEVLELEFMYIRHQLITTKIEVSIALKSLTEGLSRKSSGRAYDRMETEPGLHLLVRNTSGLKAAIKPLVRWAEKQIPEHAYKSTSLFLYATAGVRRSVGEQSKKATFGALDMGGSSLQVTFESKEHGHNETDLNLRIGAANHHLTAYSLAGYGLNDAFDKSVVHILRALPSADLEESAKGVKSGVPVQLIGAPNWEECSALAKVSINLSEWSNQSPAIDCDLQPCALSDIFPRLMNFGIPFFCFSGINSASATSVLSMPSPFRFQRWSPISSGDGRAKMPLSPTIAGSQQTSFGLGHGLGSSGIQLMESSLYPSTSGVSHSYSSSSLGQMIDSNSMGSFWSPHRSQMSLQSRNHNLEKTLVLLWLRHTW